LFKYYKKVEIQQDTTSSIVTLVRAFKPKDAARFNEQLLEMAEATVNKLSERERQDLIRFSQREVDEARLNPGCGPGAVSLSQSGRRGRSGEAGDRSVADDLQNSG
jgi:capsular polysaccharide transport system permease protein